MAVDQTQHEAFHDDEIEQPADPFEPEAPAHVDPDAEAIAHDEDPDEEAVVDEAGPGTERPAG